MTTADAGSLDTAYTLIGDAEHQTVRAALAGGDLSGTAAVVADYETALAEWFSAGHAVACSSGTAAVHLALLAPGSVTSAISGSRPTARSDPTSPASTTQPADAQLSGQPLAPRTRDILNPMFLQAGFTGRALSVKIE